MILIYFCGGDYFLWFPPAGLHSLDYETTWPWIRQLRDYSWHIAMPVLCEMSSIKFICEPSKYTR